MNCEIYKFPNMNLLIILFCEVEFQSPPKMIVPISRLFTVNNFRITCKERESIRRIENDDLLCGAKDIFGVRGPQWSFNSPKSPLKIRNLFKIHLEEVVSPLSSKNVG
jgi:hypothetical protein